MKAWLVVALGIPTLAVAEAPAPAPPRTAASAQTLDLAVTHTRIAVDAARAGHCDMAGALGAKIEALDATYHQHMFLTHPAIVACARGTAPPVGAARGSATGADVPVRTGTPPLSGGRLLGEAALGTLGGAAGLFVGALVGASAGCEETDEGPCDNAVWGMIVGVTVGVTLGVYAAGSVGDQTGSVASTTVGALAGTVVGMLVLLDADEPSFAPAVFPLAGALVGFNLNRRYRARAASTGALLHVDADGVALGVPLLTRSERDGVARTQFTLIGGSF